MLLHYVPTTVDQRGILQSLAHTQSTTLNINQSSSHLQKPFVAQCVKQFPKFPHADNVVAYHTLVEIGDPSEILCEMYGMYITREEISCLNARWWVNSVVSCKICSFPQLLQIVAIISRMLNGQQAPPVVLSNLKANATSQVIMDRCCMYLDVDILGRDLGTCDMANNVAIHKALHAYRIYMDLDVSTFVHVQPHLVQQLNGYDCGILTLKFMEFGMG
ncbi:hypothetical protein AAG906_012154 [Vitis piasezkii]